MNAWLPSKDGSVLNNTCPLNLPSGVLKFGPFVTHDLDTV